MSDKPKHYTIHDVKKTGYTLEPLKCIHCNHVGEVTYNQGIGDAHCAMCGEWQLDKLKRKNKMTKNENVENIINYIETENTLDLTTLFAEEMASRISDRLETFKQEVADKLFETKEDLDGDLSLDDFSQEELDEFMVSEEYEELDEVSKELLGRYIKKASGNLGNSANASGEASASIKIANLHNMGGIDSEKTKQSKADLNSFKRIKGISKAVKKLTKENIDQE